jgi:hypothetical protein
MQINKMTQYLIKIGTSNFQLQPTNMQQCISKEPCDHRCTDSVLWSLTFFTSVASCELKVVNIPAATWSWARRWSARPLLLAVEWPPQHWQGSGDDLNGCPWIKRGRLANQNPRYEWVELPPQCHKGSCHKLNAWPSVKKGRRRSRNPRYQWVWADPFNLQAEAGGFHRSRARSERLIATVKGCMEMALASADLPMSN